MRWPFPREKRVTIENPTVPVSSDNFLAFFGVQSANLPHVTIDSALSVPAVWAAVAFLSRTLAALPRHAYRSTKEGPKRLSGKLETVVHDAPNEETNAFKFWQYFWQQVFTGGRGLAWIERTPQGVEALWQMDPTKTSVRRSGGRTFYKFSGIAKEYDSSDVIDVPFMLKADGLCHYGPIAMAAKAIQLAIAMNDYGSNFFAGGGVPPLALTGPLPAGADAMKRAQADIKRSVDAAKNANEPVFPIPAGYTLNPVGLDPAKGQMIEARRFQVEEIARAFQLPPVFLQDLTRATFTNAEQQDLHLVKHLVGQWAEALEGELNLKLFGRNNNGRYVEHTLDGILRGDFVSRMTGYGQAIQNGIRTPDEVRALENLPAKGGAADRLYIQGATVPLGTEPAAQPANDNAEHPDEAEAA
ncbi:phage portal protein [Mesorhizobium sp. M1A.F.Ca.ET.072.01.1.1]|uniref:phage portal protein n=1 Tax=Mesorhizobium sp. M1A.F.Ca.ET.072.01.1.1 TaxID=2496753 RepID=UPI000FD46B87|nr:phage portal protein [Mesorhizobium sp. M1A.F.Ca.ET.072.01.1.1]RUW49797.1 phage portal protein [Mesorhizobium sp. M1A.F.Ca.ET.072.01.1.1]TIV04330.1 MAG: phage portal protein [Mesorhizobium sp.]